VSALRLNHGSITLLCWRLVCAVCGQKRFPFAKEPRRLAFG
jgi:hypothetical protein